MADGGHDLLNILAQLPMGMPLVVPDDVLCNWFPPWTSDGELDEDSRILAEKFGARFGCTFSHDEEKKQGCFVKNPTKH
jgi:hypothetical protein